MFFFFSCPSFPLYLLKKAFFNENNCLHLKVLHVPFLSNSIFFLYLFLFFSQLRNEKTAIPSNFPNKIQYFPYMTTLIHSFIVMAGRFRLHRYTMLVMEFYFFLTKNVELQRKACPSFSPPPPSICTIIFDVDHTHKNYITHTHTLISVFH